MAQEDRPPLLDRSKSLYAANADDNGFAIKAGNDELVLPPPPPAAAGDAGGEPVPDDMHRFAILQGLSGDELSSIILPREPPPTARMLKEHLLKASDGQSRHGKVIVGGQLLALDARIPLDQDGKGRTQVQVMSAECIEVTEAGYYNGVYEEVDRHCDRPVFKMVTPDHPSADCNRWIYYSEGGRTPAGWKCSDMYDAMKDRGRGEGWDMLREHGDVLEGKWSLNNGGAETKPNAPRISRSLTSRSIEQLEMDRAEAKRQENQNIDATVCAGCFNGEANVQMADGSFKQAKDVKIGDMLASDSGTTTEVQALVMERSSPQDLAVLGDLMITLHHPVISEGRWMLPANVVGAKRTHANMKLYNFITAGRAPIIVEGFIATSIGTYCEGLHDMSNPEHLVWGTETIIDIYRQHPSWPVITSSGAETIAAVASHEAGDAHPIWRVIGSAASIRLPYSASQSPVVAY